MKNFIKINKMDSDKASKMENGYVFESNLGLGFGVVENESITYYSHFNEAWKIGKRIKMLLGARHSEPL